MNKDKDDAVAQGTPNWRDADPMELEPHFSHWMMELTAQGLHDKGDIATVLAMLSAENAALSAQVVELQQQLVHSTVTRASVPPSVKDSGTC